MIRRVVVALAIAGLPVLVAAQQPTFRAQVDLVEIDAVVLDAAGNPVNGLTADDFELAEDGKGQTIAAFSAVDIPLERDDRPLYSPTAIEPDVLSNQREPGRTYLIVLDDMHPMLALRTRYFLRRFFERHLGANDVAAISYTGIGANNSQEFTGNRRLLLAALDRFGGNIPGERPPDAATLPGQTLPGSGMTSQQVEARAMARTALRSFRAITEFMAAVPGQRKAILFISTGTTMSDLATVVDYRGGTMSIEAEDAHAAMRAASVGHVAIYPIDPRGLTPDGGGGEEVTAEAQAALSTTGIARLTETSNLRMLADATGGFAFINQNTYDDAFRRLVRENSSYYVLGFYSTNDRRDGRFRRVQLRVKRPGLTVRARSGYVAPKGRATAAPEAAPSKNLTPATTAAFSSAIAARGIPLRMIAAPYKGAGRDASVAIAIGVDVTALDLAERDGTFSGQLELAIGASSGRRTMIGGEFNHASLALKPETLARARVNGLQILAELALAPGRYQVRAAVGDRAAKAGSVIYDLDVPDFSKGALVMSGVSLTSTSATRALTIAAKDPLRDFLPGPATTARSFDAAETVSLFVEVYDNLKTTAGHTVDLTATVRADDGRVLVTTSEQRSSSELKGSAGGFGFKADLPLTGLAAGRYVIHLEAVANTGDRPTVFRDVPITVR